MREKKNQPCNYWITYEIPDAVRMTSLFWHSYVDINISTWNHILKRTHDQPISDHEGVVIDMQSKCIKWYTKECKIPVFLVFAVSDLSPKLRNTTGNTHRHPFVF